MIEQGFFLFELFDQRIRRLILLNQNLIKIK